MNYQTNNKILKVSQRKRGKKRKKMCCVEKENIYIYIYI